jgi:hypothetical protein
VRAARTDLRWFWCAAVAGSQARRSVRCAREQRRRTRAGFSGPEAAHVLLFVRSQFGCCEVDCRSCLKRAS